MADKKLLFILFSWSLLWMMAGRIPRAHSARLKLQSANATFYGVPDASVTTATSPKPAPAPAPIINDDKKEDTKAENDSKFLIICGDPCYGMKYHGPCSKCCQKGPQDINDRQNLEEAANGGDGVGHVGGWT